MSSIAKHSQPQALSFEEVLSLPVLADAYTEPGRVIYSPQIDMKVIVPYLTNPQYAPGRISVPYTFYDDLGNGYDDTANLTIDETATPASIRAATLTYILADATNQGFTITESDILWFAPGIIEDKVFATPTRTLNSAFQISTVRDTAVTYTVDVATTLSLTTGQTGTVTLKYADDSGFTTNVKTVQSAVNGNGGTLAIGLGLTQTSTAALGGIIPTGKYAKLITANTVGTPTFTFRAAQEVLL